MPEQNNDVATLLMVARTGVRDLEREAAALPPEVAAEFLERIESLTARSYRIARAAAQTIREY